MSKGYIAKASITINAGADKVWEALIDPSLIKQYLFGTEAVSDWKEGSPIAYRGVWEGKTYEDKGRILRLLPGKLLESTYWSSMSGLEDAPENYDTIAYELTEVEGGTRLSIVQDNNPSEESARHSEGNWNMVLKGMKALLEK
jgi:uncharacterized protein YndB with AHSA1/START domain